VRPSYDVVIVGGAEIGFADGYFLSAISYVERRLAAVRRRCGAWARELIVTPVRYLAVV
jgi:hypothetical protein